MRRVIRYAVLFVLLTLVGCSRIEIRFVDETDTPVPVATSLPPTATQSVEATATPSPLPPATDPPSATVPPVEPTVATAVATAPTSSAAWQRIQFAVGATSATVSGSLAANDADMYVLRALAGQTMNVSVLTTASNVLLEVSGADGTVLKHAAVGGPGWSGVLPSTQDYWIKVISQASAASYDLTVEIPPLSGEPEPQRIQFAVGATSATINDHVAAYEADIYVLRALEGQTMEVGLASPAVDVLLEIWGADGTVLKRHVDGVTTWSGTLPSTQDYFIKVVSFGSAADYTLTVTIPPLLGDAEQEHILLASGQPSVTVQDELQPDEYRLYAVHALAGDTLEAAVQSLTSDVLLEIWGGDGTVLKHAAVGQPSWQGTLPTSQIYWIKVMAQASATDCVLTVSIPPQYGHNAT